MSWTTFLALAVPGLLVAYILLLRPVLRAVPAFREFYDTANGFWAKVWALCGRSITLVWAYFLQVLGWALQWIDPIAAALGDPDFRQQVTEALGANPKVLGYVLMAISLITIVTRVRSMTPKDE